MQRSMRDFAGPADIFRNPEAIFRFFEGPKSDDASPFDLVLTHSGDDFAVMGMHFKMGLYEHQSAGALQGITTLLQAHPELLESADRIASIKVIAYEPAYGIIGDPAKRDPRTRQSADHSMVYIDATAVRKALELAREYGPDVLGQGDEGWKKLILVPFDYSRDSIVHPQTRALMEKITFDHGGAEYDEKYPDGIPTSVIVTTADGTTYDSGLVMYPAGHARNTTADLAELLRHKWTRLLSPAVEEPQAVIDGLNALPTLATSGLGSLYDFGILQRDAFE